MLVVLLVGGIGALGYVASRPVHLDAVEGMGLGAATQPSQDPAPSEPPSSTAGGSVGATAPGAASAGPVDWWAVLAELDRRRAGALAARDASAVAGYADEGSPAWRADIAAIARLTDGGVTPVGMRTRVVAIEEAEATAGHPAGGEARLVLVDERSGYVLVDPTGATVSEVPGSDARRWQVLLGHVAAPAPDPGWRLTAVEPLP